MATFCLNASKPNNYAFFCPKSKLHLTVSNPVGHVSEVTPAIIRAVKSKCILEVPDPSNHQEPINTNNGQRPEEQQQKQEEPQKPAEEKKSATRGRKKKAETEEPEKPVEEAE